MTVSAKPGAIITVRKANTYHRRIGRDTAHLNTFRDSVNAFESVLINDSTLEVTKITLDSTTLTIKNDLVIVNTYDTATKVLSSEGTVLKQRRNWFQKNVFGSGLGLVFWSTLSSSSNEKAPESRIARTSAKTIANSSAISFGSVPIL